MKSQLTSPWDLLELAGLAEDLPEADRALSPSNAALGGHALEDAEAEPPLDVGNLAQLRLRRPEDDVHSQLARYFLPENEFLDSLLVDWISDQ